MGKVVLDLRPRGYSSDSLTQFSYGLIYIKRLIIIVTLRKHE